MTALLQRVSTMIAFIALLLAPLLFSGVLAAPHSSDRLDLAESFDFLNPFTPGPKQLGLLQEYLQAENPNASDLKRETVIFHLFVLNDFDKSGLLDGLELMQLLQELLAKALQKKPGQDSVVSMVDDILLTQDTNKDGLLSAQELVTPPVSKEEEPPAISMAIPVPEGPQTGGSELENDMKVEDNANRPAEDKGNEASPPSAEVETSKEEPTAADKDNVPLGEEANEAEEVEEAEEDNVETEDSQEEAVAANEM